jgi:glutathione reductase (NADPH)
VNAELQWSNLQEWREFKVRYIADMYEKQLEMKKPKIAVFKEEASVAGNHTVKIGGDTKKVRLLVLATGGKPKQPPAFPGSDLCITSDEALELPQKPASMLVVGAGYIAVELASFFLQVGTKVTMSIRSQMLREFDEDVRDIVEDSLIHRGLNIIHGNAIKSIVKVDESNLLNVEFNDGNTLEVETVLYAIGREPMTADLGLEPGVLDAHNKVPVNMYGQSIKVPWIFAIGDIIAGNPELQPLAIKHGARLPQILLRETPQTPVAQMHPAIPDEHMATALFATPRAGSVGLTEAEARKRYNTSVTVMVQKEGPCCEHLFMWSLMKVIVHKETERLLGIHIAGKGADETLQAFAIAMRLNPTWKQFSSAMPVHPTITEDIMFMDEKSTRHNQWRLKDCPEGQAGNPIPCGWA